MTVAVEIRNQDQNRRVRVSFRDSNGPNADETAGNLVTIEPGESSVQHVHPARKLVIEEAEETERA